MPLHCAPLPRASAGQVAFLCMLVQVACLCRCFQHYAEVPAVLLSMACVPSFVDRLPLTGAAVVAALAAICTLPLCNPDVI